MSPSDDLSVEQRYQAMCNLLLRYASRIAVISMLNVVCGKHAIEQPPQSLSHLELLIEDLGVGIRMFCPAHEVPQLMLALAEILE